MNPLQETVKDLKLNGFIEARQGKKHTIFYTPQTHQTIPVKRHDFNEKRSALYPERSGNKEITRRNTRTAHPCIS